jgi:ribulose-5-phosphate 4-epimerase/fuculose-1-phosphate aldolase
MVNLSAIITQHKVDVLSRFSLILHLIFIAVSDAGAVVHTHSSGTVATWQSAIGRPLTVCALQSQLVAQPFSGFGAALKTLVVVEIHYRSSESESIGGVFTEDRVWVIDRELQKSQ